MLARVATLKPMNHDAQRFEIEVLDMTRLLGLPQKVGQLLPWRLVIDRRFHRLIYLFGREEHGRLHTGRAG
jgi:hypothetical protein